MPWSSLFVWNECDLDTDVYYCWCCTNVYHNLSVTFADPTSIYLLQLQINSGIILISILTYGSGRMLGSAFKYVGDTTSCNWNVLLYILIAASTSVMLIWNSIASQWCNTALLIGAGEPQHHAPQVTGVLAAAAAAPQVTDAVAVSALQTAAAAARVTRILLLPHFLNTCTCYWRWWRHVFFMFHKYMTTSSLSVPTFNIRLMYVLSLLYSEITSLLFYTVNIE